MLKNGITTKDDLRAAYPFGLLAVEKKQIATYHESSGTEGEPISSYFTEEDWKDIASRFLRNTIGLNSSDTFLIKTPYSMVTTAHQAQKAGELAKCLIVPADNRTTNMPYRRVVQLLKSLEVTVTWSLPTEVMLWGLAAKTMGLDPKKDFPNLRAFWVAGEALSPARKKLISELWGGKPLHEDYGSTETGSLAGECEKGNLHVWSDRIKFEVYDSGSETISSFGKGQLLVTPLYRQAMLLNRYLIEDEVALTPSHCSCGSRYPLIEVLGRRSSLIRVQGKSLFPKELEEQVCEAGRSYGLTLWKAHYDSSSLEIGFAQTQEDKACAAAIKARVKRQLGLSVTAESRPFSMFVDPELFKQKLEFSKPIFIFRRTQ